MLMLMRNIRSIKTVFLSLAFFLSAGCAEPDEFAVDLNDGWVGVDFSDLMPDEFKEFNNRHITKQSSVENDYTVFFFGCRSVSFGIEAYGQQVMSSDIVTILRGAIANIPWKIEDGQAFIEGEIHRAFWDSFIDGGELRVIYPSKGRYVEHRFDLTGLAAAVDWIVSCRQNEGG